MRGVSGWPGHFNDCFLYGEDDHGTYVATPGKSLTDLKGELSADIVESKSRRPDF